MIFLRIYNWVGSKSRLFFSYIFYTALTADREAEKEQKMQKEYSETQFKQWDKFCPDCKISIPCGCKVKNKGE